MAIARTSSIDIVIPFVATPLGPSVRMKLIVPKVGDLELTRLLNF